MTSRSLTDQGKGDGTASRRIQELEIKDAAIIFNTIWQQILNEQEEKNLHFPKKSSGSTVRLVQVKVLILALS